MRSLWAVIPVALAAAALGSGCSSSPAPHEAALPANAPATQSGPDATYIVVGGADSVGSIPGSKGARYIYAFKQTDPSSDRFTFQDRDLSFYFRPSPTVLHFQVENRLDRPVWIDWDKCSFYDVYGGTKKVANAETRWAQRFSSLPPVQISGLQRHSNYVFPIDYLVDPGASSDQLHRPLLPEDQSAVQYVDREFGVTLVFRLTDRTQGYSFHFKVRSVLPR